MQPNHQLKLGLAVPDAQWVLSEFGEDEHTTRERMSKHKGQEAPRLRIEAAFGEATETI